MILNIHYIILVIFIICRVNADLSSDEKKELLTLHENARKAIHAPDMKDLSWDESIAKGAQVYRYKFFIFIKI